MTRLRQIPTLRRLAQHAFDEGGATGAKLRLKWILAALRREVPIEALMPQTMDPAFGAALAQRPDLAGVLLWPYQNAAWDVPMRLARMAGHYRAMADHLPQFIHPMDQAMVLMDLPEGGDLALRLVLDQPWWMMREGGLTLSLFSGDFRAFSISFSLMDEGGALTAYIGGIQGRNVDGALDIYRDMTKALFGLRPRDFIVTLLQYLLMGWGVTRIDAVRTAYQHHNHPFFGRVKHSLDYDAIWEERGGTAVDDRDYTLPLSPQRKPIDEVKAKKRKLYTQRYTFLDGFEQNALEGFPERRIVQIDAT